jgi:hypothetical protein
MNDDDRRLFIESISEMRELKGQLQEFKEHVIGRIARLECREGKRGQAVIATVSVIIAACALLFSCFSRFVW